MLSVVAPASGRFLRFATKPLGGPGGTCPAYPEPVEGSAVEESGGISGEFAIRNHPAELCRARHWKAVILAWFEIRTPSVRNQQVATLIPITLLAGPVSRPRKSTNPLPIGPESCVRLAEEVAPLPSSVAKTAVGVFQLAATASRQRRACRRLHRPVKRRVAYRQCYCAQLGGSKLKWRDTRTIISATARTDRLALSTVSMS